MYDYTRRKNLIVHCESGVTSAYDSINQAKKASRKLQLAGKTLKVIK
jgi:hypothetical protein